MAGDEETVYVHYGTPLVSEEDLNPRKRKAALDQGQARHVAPWKQEVSLCLNSGENIIRTGPTLSAKNCIGQRPPRYVAL